jgi:hypothetical protein
MDLLKHGKVRWAILLVHLRDLIASETCDLQLINIVGKSPILLQIKLAEPPEVGKSFIDQTAIGY